MTARIGRTPKAARIPDPGEMRGAALRELRALATLRPDAAALDLETRAERYEQLFYEALEEKARGGIASFMAGFDAAPMSFATRSEVQSEIEKIRALAADLANAIASSRLETIEALNECKPPNLGRLERDARTLVDAAKSAKPADHVRDGRGRKQSLAVPQTIANLAADDYFEISGKVPTRPRDRKTRDLDTDGYYGFLSDMFKALRIDVSPDTVLQKAVDRWRRRRE